MDQPQHSECGVLRRLVVSLAASTFRRYAVVAALVGLIGLGAFVRLDGLSDVLVSFNNTRQLHCAIITRATYFGWTRLPSDSRRIVAERASDRRGRLEPPIIQHIIALGYLATGDEHFWIVRLLGTMFWLAGGALLYALARALTSPTAALFAAGYYLLVPFSVVASQAFQPDPLMMLLMIASWYAIVRNDQRPSWRRAVLAGVVAGLAVLVKPVCVPGIVLLYAALTIRRLGIANVFRRREPWIVAVLLTVPNALYYLREILIGGRLRSQAEGSFMPELWSRPEFWAGWQNLLLDVTGGPYVVGAAVLGLVLAPSGRVRVALWALMAGYVVYGLAFTYHISTHNYYQLQLLPIIGLAWSSLFRRAALVTPQPARVPLAIVANLAVLALLGWDVRLIQSNVWPQTHGKPGRDARYVTIGELVHHSTRVIFLDINKYGSELEFEGEVSGWGWPTSNDLRRGRRKGLPPLDWRALLDERTAQGAEFFVSSPADEMPKQRELFRHLNQHYPVISTAKEFLVYDLRARKTDQ